MRDYMLRVLNEGTAQSDWSPDRHLEFVRACEAYINDIKRQSKLIAAQPLARQGVVISGAHGRWTEQPLEVRAEIQVGYYLVRAESLADAVTIAKANPEFAYGTTARVEVRPVKAEEVDSGFVYPTLAQ